MNKKNESWSATAIQMGGTNSGASQTFSNSTASTTINYASWESSINESNAGITQINWASAIPIYDLVADPAKKSEIRAAVQRRMEKDPITIVEVAPLYRLYSDSESNTYLTSSWSETLNLKQRGYRPDYGGTGFIMDSYVLGYVFKDRQPGTVPLYRLYNSTQDKNSYWTTSYSEALFWINSWQYYFDKGTVGSEVLGYVYPHNNNPRFDYVPLYRLHRHANRHRKCNTFITNSKAEGDHFTQWDYFYDNSKTQSKQGYIMNIDPKN